MKMRALCSQVIFQDSFFEKVFRFSKMDILKMSKIHFPFYFWEKIYQLLKMGKKYGNNIFTVFRTWLLPYMVIFQK